MKAPPRLKLVDVDHHPRRTVLTAISGISSRSSSRCRRICSTRRTRWRLLLLLLLLPLLLLLATSRRGLQRPPSLAGLARPLCLALLRGRL